MRRRIVERELSHVTRGEKVMGARRLGSVTWSLPTVFPEALKTRRAPIARVEVVLVRSIALRKF